MGRRVTIGVLLGIGGAAMFGVAIWLLADPISVAPGITLVAGESSKVGIAAGIFAIILGLLCCVLSVLEEKKTILVIAILIVLALSLATFGVALKDRLDIKKVEDIQRGAFGNLGGQSGGNFGRWKRQLNTRRGQVDLDVVFGKMKKQLVAMAVAGGVASALQIIAALLAFFLRPPETSRNAMQMEKTY